MSGLDPTNGIAPYLNPNYWDPDVLKAPAEQLPSGFNLRPAAHSALHIMAYFVGTQGVGTEIIDLEDGDTYKPGDYPPGSIVQMEVENLHSHGPTQPIPAADFEGMEIPDRPHLFADRSERDAAGRHYETSTFIGATASGWVMRKTGLYAMLRSDIVVLAGNSEGALFELRDIPGRYGPRVVVGQTQKYSTSDQPEAHGDLILRHAAVRVHAPVKRQRSTEPKTTPRRSWRPGLAFGGGTA